MRDPRFSPIALPLLLPVLVALACRGVEPMPSNRVAGAASLPATYELTETFEALPVGSTAPDYAFINPDLPRYHAGTGAMSVSDETASEGSRSLKLTVATDVPNQLDRGAAQFCVPVAITSRFTARFDIRFENFATWSAITVGPGTGFPTMSGGSVVWWTRANGTLFWIDTIFTWDPRRWYQVEVVMDLARDQASIAIDGIVRHTMAVNSRPPVVMGPPRCLMIATAWDQGPQTIFVDNVRLSATNACHEQPASSGCVDPTTHLHPWATCIVDRGQGKFTALFGFHNTGTTTVNIGVPGTTIPNRVSPGGPDRGQPRWFPRGGHLFGFMVDSEGPDVLWTLGARTALASSSTVRCSESYLDDANRRLLVDPARALASTIVATTPAGGEAPGKLAGTLDVSSTGAAVYSLPIRVPAGRLGMQPSLSLTYNSASKTNGHLGVGWSLSGLSRIQRCTKTQYQDGAAGPIRMQPSDALCLDGERLVTVSNPGGPAVYATERHDYSRISAFGSTPSGPQYFEVRARDGRILTYGYPDGASANDTGNRPARYASFEPPDLDTPRYTGGTNPDHAVILDWPLTQVRDRHGNSESFAYAAESGSDADGHAYERWPVAIHYTGHPQFPARRSVRFRWAASSSPEMRGRDIDRVSLQYVGGVKVKTSKLLEAIEIWAPNPAVPQKVRSYELAYERSPSTE